MGEAVVQFYYSIGSRYSYLASTQIEGLRSDTGCRIEWHPLYSVDLMQLRQANPFEGPPPSGQYEESYRRADIEAWAAYYGIPYREPEARFDPRLLVRACAAAAKLGAVEPFSHRLFSALYVDGVGDLGEAECVAQAESSGLRSAEFRRALLDPARDRELAATSRRAYELGAFGVPSFAVGDRVFWGNDRIVLLCHHLASLAG